MLMNTSLFSLILNLDFPHFWQLENNNLKLNEQDCEIKRQMMVNQQIIGRGITDQKVLNAMLKVPRHQFVEDYLSEMGYKDTPLPIGYYQTISQPYIVAYMTEMAQISEQDKVLEIGTGCGYQTAILAELAQIVYSIEIIPELAKKAQQNLQSLGYHNINLKIGDGSKGWAKYQPFDKILVTAAPTHIPSALIDQLAINGKMIIPVGKDYQVIEILTKKTDTLITEKTIGVCFVPLIERDNNSFSKN